MSSAPIRNPIRRFGYSFLPLVLLLLTLIFAASWYWPARAAATITVCSSGCDFTTLQGAINAANKGDTIQVLKTTPHTEYDIVVNKSVTIEGLGETTTTIQAAPAIGTAPNRVFFILAGLDVHFRDMTIKHGNTNSTGGGLHNAGSDVTMTNITLLGNEASDGGAIYSAGGILTLTNVLIVNNSIFNDGGGIYNAGTLLLVDSTVNNNENRRRGAGIFNNGVAAIHNSDISFNDVLLGSGFSIKGGGIYSEGMLKVIDSTVRNNDMAGATSASSNIGGGGIYFDGTDFELSHSTVSHNDVGAEMDGGGIFVSGGTTTISHSIIEDNSAMGAFSNTGGLYATSGVLTVQDTTINDNMGDVGGGVNLGSVSATFLNTTIHGNQSNYAGGVYVCNQGTDVNLTNVTISDNQAEVDGGGIYLCSLGELSLANVTISDNTADSDDEGSGDGGGIFLHTFNNNSGVANLRNTILAGNFDFSDWPTVAAHDCDGNLNSQGYNLIGTLGFQISGTPCSISGNTTGNQIGSSPLLDTLADNGGPTMTHALMPGSPAINKGNPAGCKDTGGGPLRADQRHGLRRNRCDIGAFERGALLDTLYMPLLIKR